MSYELNTGVRHVIAHAGADPRKVRLITAEPTQGQHGERAKIKSQGDSSPQRLFSTRK